MLGVLCLVLNYLGPVPGLAAELALAGQPNGLAMPDFPGALPTMYEDPWAPLEGFVGQTSQLARHFTTGATLSQKNGTGLLPASGGLFLAVFENMPFALVAGFFGGPSVAMLLAGLFAGTGAVTCNVCMDTLLPPGHATADCPLTTNPAANAGVLATVGSTTSLILGPEMPAHFFNIMSQAKLTRVRRLCHRCAPGMTGLATMSANAVFKAATSQVVAISDALARLADIFAETTDVDQGARIRGYVELLGKMTTAGALDDTTVLTGAQGLGGHRFTYHMAVQIAEEGHIPPLAPGTSASHSATITGDQLAFPSTEARFHEAVYIFTMLGHALGLGAFLIIANFVQKVVHRNLRAGLPWPVVAKMLEIYLEFIDEPGDYGYHNVVDAKGGMDSIREDARARVAGPSSTDFSHASGQPPPGSEARGGGKQREWNGKSSSDPKARACPVHNNPNQNAKHGRNQLDEHGTCRFRHCCNQWVSDKGPNGICGSCSHARRDCDNPNKCDKPVQ